jgi:hypothetical protein
MPRPRKNDPSSLLNPILSQFAMRIAQAVERFTISRVESAVKAQSRATRGRRGAKGIRPRVNCYYPGCTNIAAPRFGMFCASKHKNLPKTEKERYRAAHLKAVKGTAAAAKVTRARRPKGGAQGPKKRGPGRPKRSTNKARAVESKRKAAKATKASKANARPASVETASAPQNAAGA